MSPALPLVRPPRLPVPLTERVVSFSPALPPANIVSSSIINLPLEAGRYLVNLNKSLICFKRSLIDCLWSEPTDPEDTSSISSLISLGICARNSAAQSAQGRGSPLTRRWVLAVFEVTRLREPFLGST